MTGGWGDYTCPLGMTERRVAQAMQHIFQSQNWLPAQRKWLERLAKQLDKILSNQLEAVLEEFGEAMWPAVGWPVYVCYPFNP